MTRLNPIAPLEWVATYRGGGGLRQFDVDGPHWTTQVDRARVGRLELRGHPAGPLRLDVRPDQVPDEVVVRAGCELALPGPGRRVVEVCAGFRYGAEEELLVIEGTSGRVRCERRAAAP